MTCIIGAVCKDGIVLVADRRVLRGIELLTQDKIIPIDTLKNTVVASSGSTEIMDYFVSDITNLLMLQQQGDIGIDLKRGFVGIVEDIVADLYNRYASRLTVGDRRYDFSVFISYKSADTSPPILVRVFETGISRSVTTFEIIGSGESNVLPFIKTKYHKKANEITMDEFATVGSFAIKLIDRMDINLSVGGTPQIWKLPNETKHYQVKGMVLDKILERAEMLLDDFDTFLSLRGGMVGAVQKNEMGK